MVEGPRTSTPSRIGRLFDREAKQLRLPLEIPGERQARVARAARDFATGFAPRLGSKLLMRVGVPMVAATTPAVIRMLDRGWEDQMVPNLLVGSGLGGAWGALVGAAIPRTSAGVRVSRIRAAGSGAAGGVLLAPAVAMVSKLVADWATSPLQRAKQDLAERS